MPAPDPHERFQRMAAWQSGRRDDAWAEKLRKSLVLRQTVLALRKSAAADGPRKYPDERL